MNTKNIQNLIFGTSHIYLIFLFCVGLVHAQRVDVVDHLGNKAKTGTVVTEAATAPTSPKEGDIWIDTSKTPNTTNIWDGDAWKEVKPSYQVMSQDADTDTKIQLEESTDEDTIRFDTSGEERMVIDPSGNVGIGISNPDHKLQINGKLRIDGNSQTGLNLSADNSNSGYEAKIDINDDGYTFSHDSSYRDFIFKRDANTIEEEQEFMRIDSSGLLIVQGDTMMKGMLTFTESGTAKKGIYGEMAGTDQWFVGGGGTGANSGYLEISTGDDAQVGGSYSEAIYVRQYGPGSPLTGSLHRTAALLDTQGNTYFPGTLTYGSSDERLKTKTGNINNALEKVQSLSGFYYVENELAKQHGHSTESQQVGLSAQEVQAVLPEAVSLAPFDRIADEVTNDSVSKSGEDYLTVDYSRLVPLLIESIKELKAELDDAKARIAQLENN